MTGKNKELRWPDMPRIKHPFRVAAIMTCELLMVYEAVCYSRFANGIDVYRHTATIPANCKGRPVRQWH